MAYAIELEEVAYRYKNGDQDVLEGISLRVDKGSFVVIMGSAGAGKTTLTLLMDGIIPQLLEGEFRGELRVTGLNVKDYRVQTLARHVGLVFQDPESQIFGKTVAEDVAFGLRNFAVPDLEIPRRVDEGLRRVGLEGYNLRETATLSGGEKQRLAIAGMLVLEPEILVLDEPVAELDPVGRAEVYRVLEHLRRDQGLTIMVVEQDPEELVQVADSLVVLQAGKLVWQGEPKTLLRQIPQLKGYGLRPLVSAEWGYALFEQGLISFGEIPLNLAEAETVMDQLSKQERVWARGPARLAGGRAWMSVAGAGLDKRTAEDSEDVTVGDEADLNLEPMIVVRGLAHEYPSGTRALQGIDLDIFAGEFVALVGQNGAGKTTLAKHFNGLLKPTAGKVVVAGLNAGLCEPGELARWVGYVFQNPDHQIFESSVERELAYGLRNLGFGEEEIRIRVDQALEDTGLQTCRGLHPFSLGKGERQRIALASVLALTPKILVVDEPTSGLDWPGSLNLMDMLQKLNASGTTVVMVAHDMELVARYARRMVVLKGGRVFLDGPVAKAFAQGDVLHEAGIEVPMLVRLEQLTYREERDCAGDPSIYAEEPPNCSEEPSGYAQAESDLNKGSFFKPSGQETPRPGSQQGMLQRFDVRVRFLLLLAGAMIAFLFTDPRFGGVVALATLGLALSSYLPLARLKLILLALLPMFLMIALLSGFTSPAAAFHQEENRVVLGYLWQHGQGGISRGGILLGVAFLLRVLSLVLLSTLITWTTTVEEFLFLLKSLRLPDIAVFVIITALRFMPALDQKRQRIIEAQSARGALFQSRGLLHKIRAYLPLLVPLLINAILMADTLAMAMLNRGFGYAKILQRTEKMRLRPRDYLAMTILTMLAAGAIYLRFGLQLGML